jgi:hypothetical protein
MHTVLISSGKDAFVKDGSTADLNFNSAQRMTLKSGVAWAFDRWGIRLRDDATCAVATITFYAAGASTGSRTLSLQRAGDSWDPGTITFNDQPGVVGTIATASVGTLADGDPIVFTVTNPVQTIVNGAANYGFRLTTNAATAHKVYGFGSDHPPVLSIAYYVKPSKSTGIKPAGGAVSTNKPTITWPYVDPDGTDLAAVKVQIDAANNFVSGIDFDSGWVTSAEAELDLTTTAYAGLANAATTYCRVQVRDADGGESAFSDPVSFSRQDQGSLAISTPASTTIKDATPTITWALTGATQAYWQVIVTRDDDPSVILHKTQKNRGTSTSHTLPEGVIDDEGIPYRIYVRTWDNVHRVPVPGFPTYVQAIKTVTVADGAAGAPAGLTAVQYGDLPAVLITFTRATPPNSFTLVRDGRVIRALLDPDDLFVSGTTYQYIDWTAPPRRSLSYQARAVVSGDQSPRCAADTVTTTPEGTWLVDTSVEPARWIRVRGTSVGDWQRSDTYVVHRVLGAAGAVKITSAMGGIDGTFKGAMHDGDAGVSVETQLNRINLMLAHPDRILRLIGGQLNMPVVAADLSPGVHEFLMETFDKATASFKFWQVGELGFKARL